jgi:hypothetical protein
VTGLSAHEASCAESLCWHGAYSIPWLMKRYSLRSLVEIGVCTGMSTVHVILSASTGTGLDKYYLVDPWGGSKCKPGCACARQIHQMARSLPKGLIVPLRGYSVPMAEKIPNSSLDLVYVDAAHDYRNARADILAYWPKLRAHGVLAGHDFAHWRNWGEVRHDRETKRGGWGAPLPTKRSGALPPPYGVAQATQELFSQCHMHVRFNTWWIERRTCAGPLPLASHSEVAS